VTVIEVYQQPSGAGFYSVDQFCLPVDAGFVKYMFEVCPRGVNRYL
jgi:hypothetical protein